MLFTARARSPEGKGRVRRNALKHGISVAAIRDSGVSGTIARLADVISRQKQQELSGESTVVIAETACELARVRAARAALLESQVSSPAMRAAAASSWKNLIAMNAGHRLDVKWCSAISLVREPALQIFGPFVFDQVSAESWRPKQIVHHGFGFLHVIESDPQQLGDADEASVEYESA